ncbi:MAG: YkgJ family cysteine cluster protein [Desulfobulbaceae bacterium]|nr:YkgJ family cysteine cluster protein [Desulfobulbaceae bacterium]
MQTYPDLITALDAAIAATAEHLRDRLQCRPGCSDCCKGFSVLAVEAAVMQQALAALAPATRARILAAAGQVAEQCPFLLDDLCAIYPHRPLICRSQGLAIAYIDHEHEAIEVSACPINFPTDEEYPFSEENLLFMDPFNDRLAAINHDFCVKNGLPPAERIPFRAIAALTAPLPEASP